MKNLCIISRKKGARNSILIRGQSLAVTLIRGNSAHGSSMSLHYKGERRARCTGAGLAAKRGAYGVDKDSKGVYAYNGGCGENALCEAFGVSITNYGSM